MSPARNSCCHFCGARYVEGAPWPRICLSCGQTTWRNPVPVAVVLVPVGAGLLCVRRGIEPKRGQLALPGGFMEVGETWQAACARELLEETQVRIDAAQVTLEAVHSTEHGQLLVFGRAAPMSLESLPVFEPNAETMDRAVINAPAPLAFPLHQLVADAFFAARR